MSQDTCVYVYVPVCVRHVTETPRPLPRDRPDTEAKNSPGFITTGQGEKEGGEARRGASDTGAWEIPSENGSLPPLLGISFTWHRYIYA